MFKTIYTYEIKYWLRQPSTYVYAIILFGLAFVTMTGMASESPDRFNQRLSNSPFALYDMTRKFLMMVFLILPAIIGVSVFRDFNTKTHHILYSYPFKKVAYLGAKFLSAFSILIGISLMLGLGYALGAAMPWVTPELVTDFNVMVYIQLYGVIIIPTLFLISVIVFGVVLLTRNIYAGFISVLLIILIPQLMSIVFKQGDTEFWRALFDPFGFKAIAYYAQHWNVAEQNNSPLPLNGLMFWNRILWISVTIFIGFIIYFLFDFQQQAFSLFSNRKKDPRIDNSISTITKINLPKVSTDFSLKHRLTTIWSLSKMDFRYIITSKAFICLVMGGLMFILLLMSSVNARGETETLPMTWQILELPSTFYAGVINAITFLYAGLLIHRERMANMNQLVDVNPVSNTVLLISKLIALLKMQVVLLLLVMVGGIISQTMKGFYNFEIGQYLFNLLGINLIHFVIWAMLALFIQSIFTNPYLGFFVLLFAPVGFIGLAEFGPKFLGLDFLEQMMFRYNQAPGDVFGLRYSDMDGYGPMLVPYFLYKIYWLIGGMILMVGGLLMWRRGLVSSFWERLTIAKKRLSGQVLAVFLTLVVAFLSMGTTFYYESNIKNKYFTRTQKQDALKVAQKKYKAYEYINQPKISSVNINMDIYPKERQFKASGFYWVINKSDQVIDTLMLNYMAGVNNDYEFDVPVKVLEKDTIANICHVDMLQLETPLQPNDSLKMRFSNYNNPVTSLSTNDFVKKHGTYIEDDIFPRFGNWLSYFRTQHMMGGRVDHPHPSDCTSNACAHSFMAKDADRIGFEAVVSTSKDQLAIAPGYLQKEWTENNRSYYHYKMDRKIALSYLFMSGDYATQKDHWKDINLEIYYDKKHPYNIDRMMDGLKAGLAYCSENFSPYQFKQARIIEFSQTGRATAHGFPNTIPTGEGAGFIADVNDTRTGGVDYAFGTAVHEVAHQWWGHQVIPSDQRGAKMVVESLAEYVNVMVKKEVKGIDKMRKYLKYNLENYLKLRNQDRRPETPIMYAFHDQNYIHYLKGALVLYAMSDYIGEENLNNAIQCFVEEVAYQENVYTNSIELVDFIKLAVPDSLQYLITDMFETVTLYDNKMVDWTSTPLEDGTFQIDLNFNVQKYRNGDGGTPIYSDLGQDSIRHQMPEMEASLHSLPLADYLDIGIFGADKKEIYLQKHKVETIHNQVSIIVNEAPVSVAVDPYYKLIDRHLKDNWK